MYINKKKIKDHINIKKNFKKNRKDYKIKKYLPSSINNKFEFMSLRSVEV